MRFVIGHAPSRGQDGAEVDDAEYVEAVKFVRKYGCSMLSTDVYAHLNVMHDSIENGEAGDDRVKAAYINALSRDLRRKCLLAALVAAVFSVLMFVLIYLATSRLLKSAV